MTKIYFFMLHTVVFPLSLVEAWLCSLENCHSSRIRGRSESRILHLPSMTEPTAGFSFGKLPLKKCQGPPEIKIRPI